MSLTKFIRWILSHLTLIVVLLVIVYAFSNRNDFWSEQTLEHTTEQATEKLTMVSSDTQNNFESESESTELLTNSNELLTNSHELITNSPEPITNSPEVLTKNPEFITNHSEIKTKNIDLTAVEKNQPKSKKTFLKHDILNGTQSDNIEKKDFQDKNLQEQIRNRQKQLKNKMVSLIPVNRDKNEKYQKRAGKEKDELISDQPFDKPVYETQ